VIATPFFFFRILEDIEILNGCCLSSGPVEHAAPLWWQSKF